jgi:hypothetical protein
MIDLINKKVKKGNDGFRDIFSTKVENQKKEEQIFSAFFINLR